MVWAIAFLGLFVSMRASGNPSTLPPTAAMAYVVMALGGLVMLLMWAVALIKLARLSAWGWFVAVLVLHLVGLGIIGMVAYATSGPDRAQEIVYRPSVT